MAVVSTAMVELFSTTVMIGIFDRTAVSKSRPVMPKAASPMKLTHTLPGWASLAPMVSPNPVPRPWDLPHPRYVRGPLDR